MAFIKNYIRNLLGLGGDDTPVPHYKRTRIDDDNSIEDEFPSLKKLRSRPSSLFPDIDSMMNELQKAHEDLDDHKKVDNSRVRYVPIQVEAGHPSTSTPNLSYEKFKYRNVPIKYVDALENGTEKDIQKPRKHTPVRRAVHVISDEDDDNDDNDITWVDAESKTPRKPIYIDLAEDEENDCEPSDDVILVKKIKSPKPLPEYKYFVSRNENLSQVKQTPQYYQVLQQKKVPERTLNLSPRNYSKFKAPAGISKSYKKAPTPVPKWMQPLKPMNHINLTQARNNYMNLTGNARSAISKVFNLDEKRNYQELIKHVTSANKPPTHDTINLSDRSFRSTIQSQKNSLNQIKFVERGLANEKETESTREYDPITVASINSSDSEVEIIPSESSSSSVKISRVNSLKDANKDNPVTSNDWLAKLDSKYRKKRIDTQVKLKDARRESDIISKVNYEQKLAQLEHKLKYELSIPESLIEEVPPTVELPELTPEQEKLVNRALGPGPPGQLLVEKFNLRITRRDLQTLAGLNWLNDEVINFYMNLLMQRSEERKDLPKVYAANTFFYPKLMQSGQAGLKRWTRKIDIFSFDLMVVPVHLGVHWCVSLIDFKAKRVQYLDSMGGRNQPCLDALIKYLHDEHKDKKGALFDESGWNTECISKNIPQQMNGSDCGMFSCTFAEFSARNAPYTFSQQHMPYLRRKMALEILQGKLLL